MGRLKLEWLPLTCAYCDDPIACKITNNRMFARTEVMVCERCAKEIWEEETNRRLPQ